MTSLLITSSSTIKKETASNNEVLVIQSFEFEIKGTRSSVVGAMVGATYSIAVNRSSIFKYTAVATIHFRPLYFRSNMRSRPPKQDILTEKADEELQTEFLMTNIMFDFCSQVFHEYASNEKLAPGTTIRIILTRSAIDHCKSIQRCSHPIPIGVRLSNVKSCFV